MFQVLFSVLEITLWTKQSLGPDVILLEKIINKQIDQIIISQIMI